MKTSIARNILGEVAYAIKILDEQFVSSRYHYITTYADESGAFCNAADEVIASFNNREELIDLVRMTIEEYEELKVEDEKPKPETVEDWGAMYIDSFSEMGISAKEAAEALSLIDKSIDEVINAFKDVITEIATELSDSWEDVKDAIRVIESEADESDKLSVCVTTLISVLGDSTLTTSGEEKVVGLLKILINIRSPSTGRIPTLEDIAKIELSEKPIYVDAYSDIYMNDHIKPLNRLPRVPS